MFGLVERLVSLIQPILDARSVKRDNGHAVTTSYGHITSLLCLYCAAGSLPYSKRLLGCMVWKDYSKLLPTITVSKPFALNDPVKAMANLLQYDITNLVTIVIIDLLEVINVRHQQTRGLLSSRFAKVC